MSGIADQIIWADIRYGRDLWRESFQGGKRYPAVDKHLLREKEEDYEEDYKEKEAV